MANRRWARTLSVTLAVLLAICLGLVLPVVLSLYSRNVSTDSVEAAPSDGFALSAPVVLAAIPAIRLDRGTVAFVDGAGNVLPAASAAAPGPVQSGQNIRLYNATIAMGRSNDAQRPPAMANPQFPVSPFVEALLAGRYETLSLRRTTLILNGFFENPETLTDLRAEVSTRRKGLITIKGTGKLRHQTVSVDITANIGQAERHGGTLHRLPLKLSLKGEFIDFSFDGRMVFPAGEIELQGQGELSLQSGRGLARWFGAYWPSGNGLRDIMVRGLVNLGNRTLTFEKAVTRMDGNEGTGVLGLRLREPRPVVTATLAYKVFDAKPYLMNASRDTSDGVTWSSFAGGALTVPLGMHLDADLRISADRVQFGAFELGRSAMTIALKDGRLLADVADLKFNGGEGAGQITADFNGFTPKVTVRGKLEQVELGMLTGSLSGSQLVQGKGGIVADFAGSGATLHDVIKGLAGKIAVRSQSPGRIAIDLRSLAAAVRERDTVGWGSSAVRGVTGYDNLDLRLVLRDGTLLTESAEARSADSTWTAVGVINLLSERIDVRVSQDVANPGGVAGQPRDGPQNVIELHGPLREPTAKAATAQ